MKSRVDWHVLGLVLIALSWRLLAWWLLPYRDWISDEAEYWAAAVGLAQGRGFAFFDGWIWTRPPLYVLFLALHIRLFGPTALWAPRFTQAVLSVLMVYLVVQLGQRLAPRGAERRVGLIAGWLLTFSYSFASFAYFLLSETLFITLLLAAVLLLLRWADRLHAAARSWPSLIGAAGLLGLCALTKATMLPWLPTVALWVVWQAHKAADQQRWWLALRPALLLTLVICALVLPWSAYATARWGQGAGLILVDTTGGYNFALAAQVGYSGERDQNALQDALCGGVVCDAHHAARQQAAYALGWRWIRERPVGFLAKTARELIDMIQLRYSGDERLQRGYTQGAVPALHLLGLLFDDLLYATTLLLATMGLVRQQGRNGKGLVLLWLAINVMTGALVFAITRFRQPLLPFLMVYAACALATWRVPWPSLARRRVAWGSALLLGLVVLPSLLYWPPFLGDERRSIVYETWLGWRGLGSAAECDQIAQLLRSGVIVEARQRHDAADARQPRSCLALLQAQLLVAEGKIEGPEGALAFMERSVPPDNPAQSARMLMLKGDLLRQLGRQLEALEYFSHRTVENLNDLVWAWETLHPPPTTTLDLGAGLDYGYLQGFYTGDGRAEQAGNFRWSGPEAVIRFPKAGTGQPQTLVLRVHGYTIYTTPTRLQPSVAGSQLPALELAPRWQDITIALPATKAGADVVIAFTSPVFVDTPSDLSARMRDVIRQPLRFLGFQLDWARLQS